jgi:23S rRNA pseudouridine2605 synthase
MKGKKPGHTKKYTSRDLESAKSPKGKHAAAKKTGDEPAVRLNKYIASAGICSRREADRLIGAGLVSVNGKVVTEMGVKVVPGDDVRYNGERLSNERKVYLLLNKPKDFVTTVDDPHATKTVMHLVRNACRERIYPVGRLDRTTTGVLLFTNDGDLAKRLTHPRYNKKKIYHVQLDKALKQADMQRISEGIELDDGFIQSDAIAYPDPSDKRQVGIEIHSGRNRIIRRIFEKLGYKVTRLDRVYFAGLTKKNLPRGKWRFLTDSEIRMLKTGAFE